MVMDGALVIPLAGSHPAHQPPFYLADELAAEAREVARDRGRGKLVSRRILDDERQEREGRRDGYEGKLMNLHLLWGGKVGEEESIDPEGKKYAKG